MMMMVVEMVELVEVVEVEGCSPRPFHLFARTVIRCGCLQLGIGRGVHSDVGKQIRCRRAGEGEGGVVEITRQRVVGSGEVFGCERVGRLVRKREVCL
jgi:hypothetical protein